jgi:hypothetical protein
MDGGNAVTGYDDTALPNSSVQPETLENPGVHDMGDRGDVPVPGTQDMHGERVTVMEDGDGRLMVDPGQETAEARHTCPGPRHHCSMSSLPSGQWV